MPIGDWQFWVVTLLAVCALAYLLRNVLPVPFFSKRARRRKHESRATLTVGGRQVEGRRVEGRPFEKP
ncbi:MAG TPA: hypothetical protein VEB22_12220 [Phycisphaerales bacterium]|nr:hypothetical protein [Phycisphaerales bacterium]